MNIEGKKILVLGGYGLVGMAVCRELLERKPREIQVHSLRQEESEEAQQQLLPFAGDTRITVSSGDIFGPVDQEASDLDRLGQQLGQLRDEDLPSFLLYHLLAEGRPDIVIDCVNTATGIAYRDVYSSSEKVFEQVAADAVDREAVEALLEALYIPRLIRHIQVLYRGMSDADTGVYFKVGTSGTGGMGLNVPYTHSEEKPSRVLLSKSAVAGAHSMLLFLMARTPDAPITKEIKPAAAIAWKKIAHGPIYRGRKPIRLVEARPQPLGEVFSTTEPDAAASTDEILQTAYIDTGENGIFSVEEFALLTTARQMEFVTPEEIAQYMVFEIEGGNTGHDIINALDNAVLGPTYRAGLMRHWALERMMGFERQGKTKSVAFEMLGPPRNTKLLFEAHLLREALTTMTAVRESTPEELAKNLDTLVRERPRIANEVVSVGIPILLESGEILRGPEVIVPANADNQTLTPDVLENWVHDGWVDLRVANCARWIERFQRIHEETAAIPPDDTSSRYLRNLRFWDEEKRIQPGKIVGWILSVEEHGARTKR
ncbi:MAG: short-chain dehydrogenase [Acidobacteria bacterium]|nr:MAG: short-chain dehydrogenase [Acidobacteriota bacterium]